MRFTFLALLCFTSLSASAQFWQTSHHEKLPPLPTARQIARPANVLVYTATVPRIHFHTLARSTFNLEATQASVMKTAQHNMRFRIYDVASYNFSELASLFALQNRLSEAKWYYLQSSLISRQQNNNKLTIDNLMNLALVKLQIGDFTLAQADLLEARDIARSKGWLLDLIEVEKKLAYIQRNRMASLNTAKRYADEVMAENEAF